MSCMKIFKFNHLQKFVGFLCVSKDTFAILMLLACLTALPANGAAHNLINAFPYLDLILLQDMSPHQYHLYHSFFALLLIKRWNKMVKS